MVPEIQLMLRVERDAGRSQRPAWEDRGDFTAYELVRTPVNRFKQIISRFSAGQHTMQAQHHGVSQCSCACQAPAI